MNKRIYKWSLLALAVLAIVSCKNAIEPAEVVTPRNDIDTQALHTYKNSLLSRPIVMAMHYGWGAEGGSGAQLYRLPDYLDVIVVKETRHELLPWMHQDLAITQQTKRTVVLNDIDLNKIDTQAELELKVKVKRQRDKLKATWAAMEKQPSEEDQAKALEAIDTKLTNDFKKSTLAQAQKEASEQLAAIETYKFDGTCVKLPEDFKLISKDEVLAILTSITAKCGSKNQPFLAIECPFEEARQEVEKATWVVFNRKIVEPALANFTEDANTWSKNRFIPSASFIGKDMEKGFKDETHFSLGNLNRMQSILYWQAPNKAGVAYYHTEKDAAKVVETMPYGTLSALIDQFRGINK